MIPQRNGSFKKRLPLARGRAFEVQRINTIIMETTTPPAPESRKINKLSNAQYFAFRQWAENNVEDLRGMTADQLSAAATDSLGFTVGSSSASSLRSDLGWTKPLPTSEKQNAERIAALETVVKSQGDRIAALEQLLL